MLKYHILMKIRLEGPRYFMAEGRTDGRTDGRTERNYEADSRSSQVCKRA